MNTTATATNHIDVRKILTEHRYYDKSNDIYHNLTEQEIDALCSFFGTCRENEDYDEFYLHTVADNQIKKRLKRK
jgi:hypothetical protein